MKRLSFAEYRESVKRRIVRMLGGQPKFDFDEEVVEYCFSRKHHPSVPAKQMIEDALESERKSR